MQEVERAKLRDAVMSEKAIGPTDKFNREAAQESDSYEAAQAAALAKLRGRAPGDDGHAPEGQAQGNEPER